MIEVGDIFRQDPAQMARIEDAYVVEALGSRRSDPALGDRIGLWWSEWRADLRHAEVTEPPPHVNSYPMHPFCNNAPPLDQQTTTFIRHD